ncbi:MAG: choice-of-anchor R domain-containing protein [Akkermansiaceae bacterium]
MKKLITLLGTLAFTVSANAAIISHNGSAPGIDGGDIANLVASTGNVNLWSDRPQQAQSFLTGGTAATLNAITIQLGGQEGRKDYNVRLGTVSGGVFTPTFADETSYTASVAPDQFVTFQLDSPIALAANTLYAFDVGIVGSSTGWQSGITTTRTSGNEYADGARFQGSNANNYDDANSLDGYNYNAQGNDLIFHLDISVVPEPSVFALFGLGGLALILRRRR